MKCDEPTFREAWFCLRTFPRREQAAADHLRQRVGIEVFAPQIPCRSQARRAARLTLRQPLFPGYVFARFQYPQQLRHVVSTQGVNGIVRFGEKAPVVSDRIIAFLRDEVRLAEGAPPAPVFAAGERVKIVQGCFREVEGRVLSADSATDRVRVLLTLLGQEVQVSVLAGELVSTQQDTGFYPERLRAGAGETAPL